MRTAFNACRAVLAGALLVSLLPSPAPAEDSAGKALFHARCGVCHEAGPGHAGTMRLAEARGPGAAVIEQRTDLTADYIRAVVRKGLIEMPPWRQTELSDAELAQIIAYLTHARP